MAKHPDKHIREAIKYAQQRGWAFRKAASRAHIFGKLYCPRQRRDGCRMNVYSTPRKPEEHARQIIRRVNACPHTQG